MSIGWVGGGAVEGVGLAAAVAVAVVVAVVVEGGPLVASRGWSPSDSEGSAEEMLTFSKLEAMECSRSIGLVGSPCSSVMVI